MAAAPLNARADLDARLAAAEEAAMTAGRTARRLSWARLAYAVIAVALLTTMDAWSWATAVMAVALFVPIAAAHRRVERRAQLARGLVAACRAALARMTRDWKSIPAVRTPDLRALALDTAMAHDLDVAGDVSLLRLLDVGLASAGGVRVAQWILSDPPALEEIAARQASVAELRHRPDLLLANARVSRFTGGRRPAPTADQMATFRAWCEAPTRRFSRTLVLIGRVLTVLTVAIVAVLMAAPRHRDVAMLAASFVIPVQLLVAALARRHLHAALGSTVSLLARLGDLVAVLRLIRDAEPAPGRFGAIQHELAQGRAVNAFDRLSRLLDWDAVRYSPLMHFAANAAAGFDTHLADRLDHWHAAHGASLPRWIDLAADAQALIALATLGYENPDWVMPTVHEQDAPIVEGERCGHPLIAPSALVTNPVNLRERGETLVITGSNMSGKTTYLRAVGLNALLAMAGGPVCATAFSIRRSRVRTSVRVEDDLAHGSSLFFAEVSRIRDVVVDAERRDAPPVLFLLDEILHGTNAADRRQATQLVLEQLLAGGASGIITTHDAATSEAITHATPVHFTDSVRTGDDGVRMSFDYTLRPGPATTANALRILRMMGIGLTDR